MSAPHRHPNIACNVMSNNEVYRIYKHNHHGLNGPAVRNNAVDRPKSAKVDLYREMV